MYFGRSLCAFMDCNGGVMTMRQTIFLFIERIVSLELRPLKKVNRQWWRVQIVSLDRLQLRRESKHIINDFCLDTGGHKRESIYFYDFDQYMRNVQRQQHKFLCYLPRRRFPWADNSSSNSQVCQCTRNVKIFFDSQSFLLRR